MNNVTRRLMFGGLIASTWLAGNIGLADAAPVNENVTGTVPPLKQPKTNACWATVATMMHSWKKNQSVTIETALSEFGATYLAIYNNDTGLAAADKPGFLAAAGFKAEAPQNYTTQGWASLIKRYGPLWVTTAEGAKFSIHARVMTAIFGDGTAGGTTVVIVDPADGQVHTEKLSVFDQKFEQVAKQDLGNGGDLRPQVVHY